MKNTLTVLLILTLTLCTGISCSFAQEAPPSKGGVLEVTEANWDAEVRFYPGDILVLFYAPGQKPSDDQLVTMQAAVAKYSATIKFVKVNALTETNLTQGLNVTSVPTWIFARKKAGIKETAVGFMDAELLEEYIQDTLSQQ